MYVVFEIHLSTRLQASHCLTSSYTPKLTPIKTECCWHLEIYTSSKGIDKIVCKWAHAAVNCFLTKVQIMQSNNRIQWELPEAGNRQNKGKIIKEDKVSIEKNRFHLFWNLLHCLVAIASNRVLYILIISGINSKYFSNKSKYLKQWILLLP